MFEFDSNKCFYIKGEEENRICIYDDPCDEFLHSQGIIYCGVTKVQFGDSIFNVIVADSNFLELDENARSFFINHEIGHVKYNHNYTRHLYILRALGFLPKIEVQADCYAAAVIGKDAAKTALRSMIVNKKLPLASRLEMVKRYFRIKEVPLD